MSVRNRVDKGVCGLLIYMLVCAEAEDRPRGEVLWETKGTFVAQRIT